MILVLLILLSIPVQAQVFSSSSKEVLYKRDSEGVKRVLSREVVKEKEKPVVKKKAQGNLPQYFAKTGAPAGRAVIQAKEALLEKMPGLEVGEMLEAYIPHSVIAFPEEKAPVLAIVTKGKFKGAKLIGHSKLEPNSKRIFIEFTKMTFRKQTAKVAAYGLTASGQPGFEGEYHSQELKYFTGDFLASMTAAYFDSQVPRYNSLLGQVEDSSTESALKKALAAGSLSSARRFREKLHDVPEFSYIKNKFNISLIYLGAN